MNKKYKILSLTTTLLLFSVVSSMPIIKVLSALSTNINNYANKLEGNKTYNNLKKDIDNFWNMENYSKKVSYEAFWENDITYTDNSLFTGTTKQFHIKSKNNIQVNDGFVLGKENGNLNYTIAAATKAIPLWYSPMEGLTKGYDDVNSEEFIQWYIPGSNWDWEKQNFAPEFVMTKVTSSSTFKPEKIVNKSTSISSIYIPIIENQEGIKLPNSKPDWIWPDQPNPGNAHFGFRKSLFQSGKPIISLLRKIKSIKNEIIFLNQDMEKKIINSFLKLNPKIRLSEEALENDKILNNNDLENNKMPILFSLDENLDLLKELFDIFSKSKEFYNWIEENKNNWPNVNIPIEKARRIHKDILDFKFSSLDNVKLATDSIMNNQDEIKLIPGILVDQKSINLYNKLKNDKLLDSSIASFQEISLEKYYYIYKTIIAFFATNDIKISLSRKMLNANEEILDLPIWKNGKFIDNKIIWNTLFKNPSDVEVSKINFKINNLKTENRINENIELSTNLISENLDIKNINHDFFIKYRHDAENWTGGLENRENAFNINLNKSVEDIIGAKYIYTDKNNQSFNIGLNNNPLGDIIKTNISKTDIINEINKVIRAKNSIRGAIEINNSENNLFGVGTKSRDEAITSVGLENWKNAWSKFNITLVLESDKLNEPNIPIILPNNSDGIFYSYIKINNWILEDGSSNWTSDTEKKEFIKSLNLGGLKIVEMPLTNEDRKNSKTGKWDRNGHFIIKIKII